MATFFDVQLSAHYHTAKLRALYEKKHGVTKPNVSYASWGELAARVGERGPIFSSILPPERAMSVLADLSQRSSREPVIDDDSRPSSPKSVSKEAKRARKKGDLPLIQHDHAPSRHTTAMWASYNWMHERVHGKPNTAVEDHIVDTKLGKPLYRKVEKRADSDDPDAVFFEFFKSLLPREVPDTLALEGTTPDQWDDILQKMTYETIVAGCDANKVTRFQTRIVHPAAPGESIAKIAAGMDPRNWSRNFPQIFSKAYQIKGPGFCQDRFQDPDPMEEKTGHRFNGYLFEDAAIEMNAVRMLRGRTLLRVKFEVPIPVKTSAPKASKAKAGQPAPNTETGKVSCVYSLHEALSNHVLCLVAPSGPDVDAGPEGFYEVELKNDVGGRWLSSTAGKTVRFSERCYFADEQNAFALPLWSLAIIAGLVRSVTI